MSSDTYLGKSTQGFSLFSKLPLEIQGMIWEEVCNLPNVIVVMWRRQRGAPPTWHFDRYQTIPSVLHTCVEARRVALQKYDVILSELGPEDVWDSQWPYQRLYTRQWTEANRKKIYINYAADTMACPCWDTALDICPDYPVHSAETDLSYCGVLQHIVVGNFEFHNFWRILCSWIPTELMRWLPRLQSIRVGYPRGPLTLEDNTKLNNIKRGFEHASEKRIEDIPGSPPFLTMYLEC
ncbi:hypothetical protein CJF30_00001141 [Rutstroemia sp. NJR-2017a BBW]|nr:hypothetical protein CJF30_00001141 [Rutstroemia sp. NJR-2017a BBW]